MKKYTAYINEVKIGDFENFEQILDTKREHKIHGILTVVDTENLENVKRIERYLKKTYAKQCQE